MFVSRAASAVLAAAVLLAGPVHAQAPGAATAFEEGLALYLEGDYAGAGPHLLRAAELDPGHSRALLYGALAHNNLGRYAVSDSLVGMLATMEDELEPYDRGWLGYLQHRLRGDNEGARRAVRGIGPAPWRRRAGSARARDRTSSGRTTSCATTPPASRSPRHPRSGRW